MTIIDGALGMSVLVTHEEGRTAIVVAGEIDLATAPTFGAYVDGVVVLGRGDVVLDLRQVTFMDSTGISVVARAARLLAMAGHSISIRPSPCVHRVLDITGLTRRLTIEA